jgi:hypothetical protein
MKFELYITMDSDAFQPSPQSEVARILSDLANRIAVCGALGHADMGTGGSLFDSNGNKVGNWAVR